MSSGDDTGDEPGGGERPTPLEAQAEIVFNDAFVEYLAELTKVEASSVLVDVVALCGRPLGDHALGNKNGSGLAGWFTLYVLKNEHRVVFSSRVVGGVRTVEVLCGGPRRASAVYDFAANLVDTGRFNAEEATQIWEALVLLETVAEKVGLNGWDYAPPPGDEGLQRAAVRSGLIDAETAKVLSRDELLAVMSEGWSVSGPDPEAAMRAALNRARSGVEPGDVTRILRARSEPRCGAAMPRTGKTCIRRFGHPGAHRSTP